VRARHEPVLVAETLAWLRHGPGLYLDATLGDGGHAEALLDAEPGARLLGCDRDPASLAFARVRLERFGERVTVARAAFSALPAAHREAGGEPLTGALLDLGISSRQLDDPARGMSFQSEGPLDLRMDPEGGVSAADRLKDADEGALAQVLRAHGDLRAAGVLARALVTAARGGKLATTRDLVEVLDQALGGRPHPRRYAQAFQALRIWVNDEAAELEAALQWLPEAMSPGGVVVTIAYHSGEDRRIKQALRGTRRTFPSRRLPPQASETPGGGPWEELTRHVVTPTQDEVGRNPRARSARLRAFRRRAT
jgi:16S rRNA (cytosine1402-N4)-methyltransferase